MFTGCWFPFTFWCHAGLNHSSLLDWVHAAPPTQRERERRQLNSFPVYIHWTLELALYNKVKIWLRLLTANHRHFTFRPSVSGAHLQLSLDWFLTFRAAFQGLLIPAIKINLRRLETYCAYYNALHSSCGEAGCEQGLCPKRFSPRQCVREHTLSSIPVPCWTSTRSFQLKK